MKSVKCLLALSLCLVGSVCAGGDWPLHFDSFTKSNYTLVVLSEKGGAEVLIRETHADGQVYFLHESSATWGYFEGKPAGKQPNIWISTSRFRFDYRLEKDRLTEIDKMGVQKVLRLRKNTTSGSK